VTNHTAVILHAHHMPAPAVALDAAPPSRWLICRVHPLRLAAFLDRCTALGVAAYSPTVLVRHRVSGKRRPIVEPKPAYPGYAFIVEDTLAPELTRAPGYHGFVLAGAKPATLGAAVVERMRSVEAQWHRDFERANGTGGERLKAGQRVRVKDGWFEGSTGTVIRDQTGKTWARVWLDDIDTPIDFPACVIHKM